MPPLSRDSHRLAYAGALGIIALAIAFPISLMIFNPTLIFQRGWEQYAGTTFYFIAVALLGREVLRFWADDRAFQQADRMLEDPHSIADSDNRLLPARIRGLCRTPMTIAQLVEINRESSALDQDHAAGRFTLPRYILYLLPVIGFIGTVEGISKALMNISKVLPMVKELDGFLENLTSVTDALNIAFDSTLLALFLSAALMLVQTVVQRRAEDLLTRVDRWVVEHVLPTATAEHSPLPAEFHALQSQLASVEQVLASLALSMGPQILEFSGAVNRLPAALSKVEKGASAFEHLSHDLQNLSGGAEALRKGSSSLLRIESALVATAEPDPQLDEIRRSVDRSCLAIESLAGQFATAFERNSRTTGEHLARTLGSLKEALDMLNVSMEQGNVLYRNIVKKMVPLHGLTSEEKAA